MSKPFKPEVWEDYRPSGGDTVLVTGLFRFEMCPICGTLMYRGPYNSAAVIDEMKARPTVGAEWQSDYEHVCRTCYDECILVLTLLACTATPTSMPTGTDEVFVTDTPGVTLTAIVTALPSDTPWFLTPTPEAFLARARVTADPCLRLRTAPEVGSILDCVPLGDEVDVLDDSGAWWLVEVPFGSQGWMSSQYLEVVDA